MVKIIADTTSCLDPEVARKYSIPVIPQIIHFGNETFVEGVDIDNAGFMERLKRSATLPKTAAPPIDLFVEEFKKLQGSGETVLCIHPSTEVSGTVRSAEIAARDFPGMDIRVIDTRLIANPLGTIIAEAARWAEAGLDADTIQAQVMEMASRSRLYAAIDTLEYLQKGGRIGGAAALLGTMLQLKPIITFRDGKVDQFERERTHRRALARLKELTLEQCPKDKAGFLTVLHAAVQEEAICLADDLKRLMGLEQVPVYDVPPAIATHAGPGLLGVAFFVKPSRN